MYGMLILSSHVMCVLCWYAQIYVDIELSIVRIICNIAQLMLGFVS